MAPPPPNGGRSHRPGRDERLRRQQEWRRLRPEQKEAILQALYGKRPPQTQMQMRLDQTRRTRP